MRDVDNVRDLCVPTWHKFHRFKKGCRFRPSHDKLLMILWTGNRDRYRELASQKGRVVQHDIAKTFKYLFALCSPGRNGHGFQADTALAGNIERSCSLLAFSPLFDTRSILHRCISKHKSFLWIPRAVDKKLHRLAKLLEHS